MRRSFLRVVRPIATITDQAGRRPAFFDHSVDSSKGAADMTTEAELIDLLDAHRNRPVPGSGLARMIGGVLPQSIRPLARGLRRG